LREGRREVWGRGGRIGKRGGEESGGGWGGVRVGVGRSKVEWGELENGEWGGVMEMGRGRGEGVGRVRGRAEEGTR